MRVSTLFATSLAALAVAAPVERNTPGYTDVQILNYALTLEHLEYAFYSGALAKFKVTDFVTAGLPESTYFRFQQILQHEQAHVSFLTTALGSSATAACSYSFPYTDPKSFAALSMILEGVGVSAYLGAAQYISNPAYLTAAGAILTTESRHAAYVAAVANGGTPWSGALDVPLDLDQVYSLASAFITSCPSTNPALPVKAFPGLTVTPKSSGSLTMNLKYTGSATYLALYTGLSVLFVPITNSQATLPSGLTGTVYAVATTSGSAVTDDNTVAGPAILQFPDGTDPNASGSGGGGCLLGLICL